MTDSVFKFEQAWSQLQSDKATFRHGYVLLEAQATGDDAEASGQKVWEVANQTQREILRVKKGQVTLDETETRWLVWICTSANVNMDVLRCSAAENGLVHSYGTCSDRKLSDGLKGFTGMQDVHPPEEPLKQQEPRDVTSKRKRTQQQDKYDVNQPEKQQQQQQQHVPEPMAAELTGLGTGLHCEATVEAVVGGFRERCKFLVDTACDALHQAAKCVNAHPSTFVEVRSTPQ